MFKHGASLVFVIVALAIAATAQSVNSDSPGPLKVLSRQNSPAPPYCNPCIFYSGDFDPQNGAEPNGLLNGLFKGGTDGEVWVPFTVATKIKVTGLFINELFASPPPPVVTARWGIRSGISPGNGGKVQCRGTATAHASPTGRTFVFAGTTYVEWTYLINLPTTQDCELRNPHADDMQPPGGKGQCPPNCYMLIEPDTTAGAAEPAAQAGYLSDVPKNSPANHFGLPNVNDNSFFSSTSFGFHFVPAGQACAMGPPLAITKVGCHMFSVGLIGLGQ